MGLFSIFNIFGSKSKAKKRKGYGVKPTKIKQRFDLENRVGQGSMSKVWRARDRESGRSICLKVLDKEKTNRFEERFIGLQRPHEGLVCQSLKHRNIVQTFDWGVSAEGELFLVMEYIEGVGMNFLIETKARQLEGNRINFLCQTADALQYVHDQGYMHRDICPRNIMVTPKNVVKLIDFGLTIPNRPEFRRPGNRTGSANYMAPELIKRVATDQRVDLFALGVTAYETFTNSLPWEGAQSLETMRSHLNNPGRDPRDIVPDMADDLAELLIKAVERNPADRFQTPTELREALKALEKQDY